MASSSGTVSKSIIDKVSNGIEVYYKFESKNGRFYHKKGRMIGKRMVHIKPTNIKEYEEFKLKWVK